MKMIQARETNDPSKSSAEATLASLKEPLIEDLLRGELEKWTAAARADFAKLLGHAEWKNPSSKVLHPVDRVTARFACKRCGKVPRKYAEAGSFDFVGACAHECRDLDKAHKEKRAWKAEYFAPDQKVWSYLCAGDLTAAHPCPGFVLRISGC